MISSYIIEGIDFLGKSTLIKGLRNKLGYFEVIHYQKPELLDFYDSENKSDRLFKYQRDSFNGMFNLLKSNANIIFDRGHLGESVYSPIYRNYDGTYVFSLELEHGIHLLDHVKLILLVEDFTVSRHFVDDGESFDITKREQEQQLFIAAFERSRISNKKMICVTDKNTGRFMPKEWILQQATQ